jgi:hypothetical protein
VQRIRYEILYWDPTSGKQILGNPRNARWATKTTLLGFDVMGIWPDGALTDDVNSVDRSHSEEYCVTGQSGNIRRDSGNIRRDSGNIRRDSGNIRRDSGNIRRDSVDDDDNMPVLPTWAVGVTFRVTSL